MKYELKKSKEKLGPLELTIESIADLDKAIDTLCAAADTARLESGASDELSTERALLEELCPYFGVIWPAARALAEHLARMGDWIKGKRVLEVGCGLAIPSLVASKLGAETIATDFHPEVPFFLHRNQENNNTTLQYEKLDWRQPNSRLGTFDFVIGSDILYESQHPKDVAKALAQYCKPKGHILLSDPGRAYLQSCVDELTKLGFRHDVFVREVRDVQSESQSCKNDRAGDQKTKEVFVFSFTSR